MLAAFATRSPNFSLPLPRCPKKDHTLGASVDGGVRHIPIMAFVHSSFDEDIFDHQASEAVTDEDDRSRLISCVSFVCASGS
jgi:hypothetical protein